MKKTDFDDYVADYNKILEDQLNFFEGDNHYFAEYKVKQAKRFFQHPPTMILDFGCGIGRSMPFFQKHFPDSALYGCDTSEKSIQVAKKQFPATHFCNTEELAASNLRFDLIFLSGVLHHVEPGERKALVALIASVLKPRGSMFIFEHNPFNPVTKHLVNTCPFDRGVVLLKPKETKSLLAEAGIHEIECQYTLFFPRMLKWLRPLEDYLRFLPLGGQYLVRGISGSVL